VQQAPGIPCDPANRKDDVGKRRALTTPAHSKNTAEDTRRVFSSRISVRVIGGSARWPQFRARSDAGKGRGLSGYPTYAGCDASLVTRKILAAASRGLGHVHVKASASFEIDND
jgi:hypothetical protein